MSCSKNYAKCDMWLQLLLELIHNETDLTHYYVLVPKIQSIISFFLFFKKSSGIRVIAVNMRALH